MSPCSVSTSRVVRLWFLVVGFALFACDPDTTSRQNAEAHIGPIMECGLGEVAKEFCEEWTRASLGPAGPHAWFFRRVCSSNVEAFAACSGTPGRAGVHCEICGGVSTDVIEGDLGAIEASIDGGLLYCYAWDSSRDFREGEGHLVSFAGGNVELGTPQAGVTLSCGGYETLDGIPFGRDGSGLYCSASTYVDLSHVGVPLHCELGIIVLDPQELLTELYKLLGYDAVKPDAPNPQEVQVDCRPGDNRSTVQERCYAVVNGIDSGAHNSFGRPVSCKDAWENACNILSGDCPPSARRRCDFAVDTCIARTARTCPFELARRPGNVRVECLAGDTSAAIEDRCYATVGPMRSTATGNFGGDIACEKVWQNRCFVVHDCPLYARAHCDTLVDGCVLDSQAACRRP